MELDKAMDEGIDPRRDIRRLTLGLSLTGDDERPVDHWVLRLEGRLKGFKEGAVADLARALAEEAATSNGSELSLDVDETADDRLLLKVRREGRPEKVEPATGRKAVRVKTSQETLHGKRVMTARVKGTGAGEGAVEVGLARLDEHTLLIGERRGLERTLAALAGESVGLRANPKLWRIAERLPADAGFWLMISPDEILRRAEKIKGALGWGDELPEVTGPHAADEQARVLSLVSGGELRMALSKVTAVAISDPKIADARIDRGAVVIKAKRPGRTDMLVERPGRPKQRYSIQVTERYRDALQRLVKNSVILELQSGDVSKGRRNYSLP